MPARLKTKFNASAIPAELRERRQWLCWRVRNRGGKLTKVPVDAKTGKAGSSTNPETWSTFEEAVEHAKRPKVGIGFVFTPEDPYCGFDLDGCLNETGAIEPWAEKIVADANTYTEVSPSGMGLKLIVRANPGFSGAANDFPDRPHHGLAVYFEGRFFVITGNRWRGTPEQIAEGQTFVDGLKEDYPDLGRSKVPERHAPPGRVTSVIPVVSVIPQAEPMADEDLAERLVLAKKMRLKDFEALWEGRWKDIGHPSQSEADLALCNHLAFLCEGNAARVDAMFRRSKLHRAKWDRYEAYRTNTIKKALESRAGPAPKKVVDDFLNGAKGPKAVTAAFESPSVLQALSSLYHNDRPAYQKTVLELRENGARAGDLKRLEDAVKAVPVVQRLPIRAEVPARKAKLKRIKEMLPEAPISDQLVLAEDMCLSLEEGVRMIRHDKEGNVLKVPVIDTPLILTERCVTIQDGSEQLRLVWFRDGAWKSELVGRAVVATARDITTLASRGLPVTSNNAKLVVEYLIRLENLNEAHLLKRQVSRQLGWQDATHTLFLSGASRSSEMRPKMHFQGADVGDEQIAAGFHTGGTREEWVQAAEIAAGHPSVLCTLYAALAPPLLRIVGAPNFTVDLCGETSRGKTTALRLAASAWGNPDETSTASAMATWDATAVGVERRCAVLNDLPVILDDTKRAGRPELITKLVYAHASGQGRIRGSVRGSQVTGTWSSILLSSGEEPIVSFAQKDGGAHARVLTLWGTPFQGDAREAVSSLNRIAMENFGHAGPRFVTYLIENAARHVEWKERFRELCTLYAERAGKNIYAGRQAACFAVLHLAGEIAKEALGLPGEVGKTLDAIWKMTSKEVQSADRATEALLHVMSYARSHAEDFQGHPNPARDSRVPSTGWQGIWLRRPKKDNQGTATQSSPPTTPLELEWEEIAFYPSVLRQVLTAAEFPDAVVRTWAERGWLRTALGDRGLTVKISFGGERQRCYAIRRQAVLEAEGERGQQVQHGDTSLRSWALFRPRETKGLLATDDIMRKLLDDFRASIRISDRGVLVPSDTVPERPPES